MREVLYKNFTNPNKQKRDLCVKEVVEQNGVVARIEKRRVYFVRQTICIKNSNGMACLKNLRATNDTWKKRHFHIMRRHNSNTGEDKLICKATGTLYAIIDKYIFCVAFIHSLKIDLSSLPTGSATN